MKEAAVAIAVGASACAAGLSLAAALAARARERVVELAGAGRGRAVSAPGSRASWLARRAALRGWPGDHRLYGAVSAAAAVAGAWAGWRLAGPVAMVAGLVGPPLAIDSILARRSAAERARSEEQLREAVAALAAATRAGLSVRRALEEAVRDAEPPLRGVLEETLRRVRLGEPLDRAVAELPRRLRSSDARLLAAMLAVNRRTGGDLPGLLDELSSVVGRRVGARRQVRALTAQGRASGTVLAVLPVAFIGLLSGTSGNGLGAFYRTPLGAALLAAGLLLQMAGFAWIRRLTRPEAAG